MLKSLPRSLAFSLINPVPLQSRALSGKGNARSPYNEKHLFYIAVKRDGSEILLQEFAIDFES